MENNSLLLGQIKATVDEHGKKIDDHEDRIRAVENITNVISIINENVEKQGANIDKLASSIEIMNKTQQEMNLRMQETEMKIKYKTYIKIANLLKTINWKKVVLFLLGLSGAGGIATLITLALGN